MKNLKNDFGSSPIQLLREEKKRFNPYSALRSTKILALRHGQHCYIEETKSAGVFRLRVINLLERWLRSGKINSHEKLALDLFARDFYRINKPVHYSSSQMIYVDNSSSSKEVYIDYHKQRDAENRLSNLQKSIGKARLALLINVFIEGQPMSRLKIKKDKVKSTLLNSIKCLTLIYLPT
jgi:hypothetical protein